MSDFKELLALIDQYSDNALLVALVVMFGVRRYLVGAFEAQLSAWHKKEHEDLCGLPCKKVQ